MGHSVKPGKDHPPSQASGIQVNCQKGSTVPALIEKLQDITPYNEWIFIGSGSEIR
jgi:hypothetical protein